MVGKITHLQVTPQQSTQTQQICHYRYARKPVNVFLWYNTNVDFICRNNFANLGSFAKVSIPVQSIIPWSKNWLSGSCDTPLSIHRHIAYFYYNYKYICTWFTFDKDREQTLMWQFLYWTHKISNTWYYSLPVNMILIWQIAYKHLCYVTEYV